MDKFTQLKKHIHAQLDTNDKIITVKDIKKRIKKELLWSRRKISALIFSISCNRSYIYCQLNVPYRYLKTAQMSYVVLSLLWSLFHHVVAKTAQMSAVRFLAISPSDLVIEVEQIAYKDFFADYCRWPPGTYFVNSCQISHNRKWVKLMIFKMAAKVYISKTVTMHISIHVK